MDWLVNFKRLLGMREKQDQKKIEFHKESLAANKENQSIPPYERGFSDLQIKVVKQGLLSFDRWAKIHLELKPTTVRQVVVTAEMAIPSDFEGKPWKTNPTVELWQRLTVAAASNAGVLDQGSCSFNRRIITSKGGIILASVECTRWLEFKTKEFS